MTHYLIVGAVRFLKKDISCVANMSTRKNQDEAFYPCLDCYLQIYRYRKLHAVSTQHFLKNHVQYCTVQLRRVDAVSGTLTALDYYG